MVKDFSGLIDPGVVGIGPQLSVEELYTDEEKYVVLILELPGLVKIH